MKTTVAVAVAALLGGNEFFIFSLMAVLVLFFVTAASVSGAVGKLIRGGPASTEDGHEQNPRDVASKLGWAVGFVVAAGVGWLALWGLEAVGLEPEVRIFILPERLFREAPTEDRVRHYFGAGYSTEQWFVHAVKFAFPIMRTGGAEEASNASSWVLLIAGALKEEDPDLHAKLLIPAVQEELAMNERLGLTGRGGR